MTATKANMRRLLDEVLKFFERAFFVQSTDVPSLKEKKID